MSICANACQFRMPTKFAYMNADEMEYDAFGWWSWKKALKSLGIGTATVLGFVFYEAIKVAVNTGGGGLPMVALGLKALFLTPGGLTLLAVGIIAASAAAYVTM